MVNAARRSRAACGVRVSAVPGWPIAAKPLAVDQTKTCRAGTIWVRLPTTAAISASTRDSSAVRMDSSGNRARISRRRLVAKSSATGVLPCSILTPTAHRLLYEGGRPRIADPDGRADGQAAAADEQPAHLLVLHLQGPAPGRGRRPGPGRPARPGVHPVVVGRRLPIVALGHGWLQSVDKYADTMRYLASWGIIVVAPNTHRSLFSSHQGLALDPCPGAAHGRLRRAGRRRVRATCAGWACWATRPGGGAAVLSAAKDEQIPRWSR